MSAIFMVTIIMNNSLSYFRALGGIHYSGMMKSIFENHVLIIKNYC